MVCHCDNKVEIRVFVSGKNDPYNIWVIQYLHYEFLLNKMFIIWTTTVIIIRKFKYFLFL